MGAKSDIVRRRREEYIKEGNRKKVQITNEASASINSIRKAANLFDVIDSWNKLNVSFLEFYKFVMTIQIQFGLSFFKELLGMIKGGTAPLFDAGINIEVVKSELEFEHKYALCTKNKYINSISYP